MEQNRASSSDLKQIREVHRELKQAIERLRNLVREEKMGSGVVPSLGELLEQLAAHFAHEEKDGYFREAVRREPRLHAQAELLRRQHPGFLAELEELQRLAEGLATSHRQRRLSVSYESFQLRFRKHEEAEGHLFLEAFNTDIGVGD